MISVVSTGAPAARRGPLRRRRRGRLVSARGAAGAPGEPGTSGEAGTLDEAAAAAIAVPVTRLTVIQPEPFNTGEDADAWLSELRSRPEAAAAEIGAALNQVNRVLRAHRAAAEDPHAGDVSERHAVVRRVGYGDGAAVAEGRYAVAVELPPGEARASEPRADTSAGPPSPGRRRGRRRAALAPQERLAAILGGRDRALACEELVLRAQADLDAGRLREAALQARVALEAALAELEGDERVGELRAHREATADAANAALDSDLDDAARASVESAVEAIAKALVRRRSA